MTISAGASAVPFKLLIKFGVLGFSEGVTVYIRALNRIAEVYALPWPVNDRHARSLGPPRCRWASSATTRARTDGAYRGLLRCHGGRVLRPCC